MPALLELTHELLHCVFTEIDPADLAALDQSCSDLHNYIRGNRLLHKELYLRRYDKPAGAGEPDWEGRLHRAVKLEKILQSNSRDVKRERLPFVSEQMNRLLETACADPDESKNIQLLRDYFCHVDTRPDHRMDNRDVFLCASSLWDRGGTSEQAEAPTAELRQASAKLHCLFGKPIETVQSSSRRFHTFRITSHFALRHMDITCSSPINTRSQSSDTPAHMVARAKVYDLREYTDNTLWGPFTDDGTQRVDWEKVEAVMLVLGFNLNKFTERSDGRFWSPWDLPFAGATPGSYISPPPSSEKGGADEEKPSAATVRMRELAPLIDSLDPYGVTGTWMRVVCFLDYNDLYAFNFGQHVPAEQRREPIDTEEAIRLIRLKLQVTRIDPPGSGDEDEEEDGMDWSNFQGERLPVVHFRGDSRSLHANWDHNANSKIRGTVRQTPEGEIRWTTFSIFHGEERWRSEGIQVGGLRSARGVLGNWFDKDYDMHGPAGPTAFWKETDDLTDEKPSSTPLAFF